MFNLNTGSPTRYILDKDMDKQLYQLPYQIQALQVFLSLHHNLRLQDMDNADTERRIQAFEPKCIQRLFRISYKTIV
ncbi:hypothetical protein DPMN_159740 [Dreissena polymorpha]|uniref:Uncharacterized protein n=1 Tax=Dreissena polymorpha TaxID=45954 RepID=A0A9D4IRZ3_DREPO|nr:hypothetical protein DPMN_159740 [Dreissena polymorpha]